MWVQIPPSRPINKLSSMKEKERKRVCCNCGNNKRIEEPDGINCYCSIDGHRIGYIECFEHWCRRWKKDRTWDNDEDIKERF